MASTQTSTQTRTQEQADPGGVQGSNGDRTLQVDLPPPNKDLHADDAVHENATVRQLANEGPDGVFAGQLFKHRDDLADTYRDYLQMIFQSDDPLRSQAYANVESAIGRYARVFNIAATHEEQLTWAKTGYKDPAPATYFNDDGTARGRWKKPEGIRTTEDQAEDADSTAVSEEPTLPNEKDIQEYQKLYEQASTQVQRLIMNPNMSTTNTSGRKTVNAVNQSITRLSTQHKYVTATMTIPLTDIVGSILELAKQTGEGDEDKKQIAESHLNMIKERMVHHGQPQEWITAIDESLKHQIETYDKAKNSKMMGNVMKPVFNPDTDIELPDIPPPAVHQDEQLRSQQVNARETSTDDAQAVTVVPCGTGGVMLQTSPETVTYNGKACSIGAVLSATRRYNGVEVTNYSIFVRHNKETEAVAIWHVVASSKFGRGKVQAYKGTPQYRDAATTHKGKAKEELGEDVSKFAWRGIAIQARDMDKTYCNEPRMWAFGNDTSKANTTPKFYTRSDMRSHYGEQAVAESFSVLLGKTELTLPNKIAQTRYNLRPRRGRNVAVEKAPEDDVAVDSVPGTFDLAALARLLNSSPQLKLEWDRLQRTSAG